MTLEDRVITGESHAPTPSYPRPPPGPPPRRRAPASPSEVQGLQTPDLGPGPLGALAGRRGPDHLVVRRRPTPPRRPLRRDGTPGARGHPARRRHTATTAQRRLGRTLAQGAPQTPSEAGHRLDLDPLPRPSLPQPRRELPRPGPERHQPLPRLRHRFRHPQGAALHRGPDRRQEGRVAQAGGPTSAPSGRLCGHPAPTAPVGSRVLPRGGRSLPPGGAGAVPDAGGLSRPCAQAPERPQRQLCLPDVDETAVGRPTPWPTRRGGRRRCRSA